MPLKIKNKKILFIILSLALFLIFPFKSRAFNLLSIVNIGLTPIYILLAVISAFIVLLTSLFAELAGVILDWVTKPNFISYKFTVPCPQPPLTGPKNCNPIIGIGLPIVQGFVNIGIIAALIVIAISIALKLKEYGSQKLFFKLIVIALLVNFAPLICGLIVDGANIITNYFLDGIRETATGSLGFLKLSARSAWESLKAVGSDFFERTSALMQSYTMVFLNLFVTFVFFLFFFIFLIRYIAIWILVILSPLAFVASILPMTKKFWDIWWKQFIQWSIIGIPMAFFLYLALNTFPYVRETLSHSIGGEYTWFDKIFPYFVVACFLFLGFMYGLQTAAIGANTIFSGVRKYSKQYGAKIGKGILARGGKWAKAGFGRALGARGKEWMERQAAVKYGETFGKKPWQKILAGVGTVVGLTPAVWAVRRWGLGETGLRLVESEAKDVGKAQEKLKNTFAERKFADFRNQILPPPHRIGALLQAIKEGQIKDFRRLAKEAGISNADLDKEIIEIGKAALRIYPDIFKLIRDTFPHLAEKMGEGFKETIQEKAGLLLSEEEKKRGITLPMKILMGIEPEFIPKIDENALLHPDVQTFFHRYATPAQVSALLTYAPTKVREVFIKQVMENGIEYYEEKNPDLADFFKSNPGIIVLGG
jgi:hypothetical protein